MRYLVDGMNVIGSHPNGWWRDRDGAMARLVAALGTLAEAGEDRYAVVFERAPRMTVDAGAVEVLHAPRPGRDAADNEIVRILENASDPGSVTVVTSDRALGRRVAELGGKTESAGALLRRLGR